MSFATLGDLLYSFQSSLGSCEIRTFLMLHDDRLVNLVTSLLFSHKPLDQKRNSNLDRVERAFSTGEVRFLYKCIDPLNAYSIFQDISMQKIIRCRSFPSVEFSQFNALELQVDQSYRKTKDNFGWNIFYCEHQREQIEQNVWSLLESQRGKAINLNYSDMYDLLNDLLKINDYRSGDKRDFIVQVPVYARIVELTHEKVKVQMHHTINNLLLNLALQRAENYQYVKIERKQIPIERCNQINKGPFCYFENDLRFQKKIKPRDFIDGLLLNSKIPVLTLDQNRAFVPLENTVEPFANTLFNFYPIDVFKKHLFEPINFKKPEEVFQDAIIRLLSLLGLPTAVQGNREYVKDKEKAKKYEVVYSDSIPIGSADIISYIENEKILLIDCTIETPDDSKINRLCSLAKYFSFIQDGQGYPRISSLIFTPKDCRHIQIQQNNEVKIIDKFSIENLLELALQGKTENARNSLCY